MALQYCCIQIKLLPSFKYSFWWPWIPVTFDPHQGKKKNVPHMHIEHMWHLFDCAALKFRHFAAASSQVTVSSDLWVHIHFKKNLLFSQSSSKHKQLQGTFNNTCILSMLHFICFCSYQYAAINQKLKNHSNLNTIQHYSYDFWFVLLAVNVKWSVYTSFLIDKHIICIYNVIVVLYVK